MLNAAPDTERGVAAGAQCSEQRTFGLYFCQSDRADQLCEQVAGSCVIFASFNSECSLTDCREDQRW